MLARNRALWMIALAGSLFPAACSIADGKLEASFDLNGNGTNESWAISSFSRPWFSTQFTIVHELWNGVVADGYKCEWVGTNWSKQGIPPSPEGDTEWAKVFKTEVTKQSVIERTGIVKWTPASGGDTLTGNAGYYGTTRSVVAEIAGEVKTSISGGNGGRSIFNSIEFKSTIADGIIIHEATNLSDTSLGMIWARYGMSGMLAPGESYQVEIAAPFGALERVSAVSHDMYLPGAGMFNVNTTARYWLPVPGPGPIGLAGASALSLALRRRR